MFEHDKIADEIVKRVVGNVPVREGLENGFSTEIAVALTEAVNSSRRESQKKLDETTLALALMWNQYCSDTGHQFMTAGEHAARVLGLDGSKGGESYDTGELERKVYDRAFPESPEPPVAGLIEEEV